MKYQGKSHGKSGKIEGKLRNLGGNLGILWEELKILDWLPKNPENPKFGHQKRLQSLGRVEPGRNFGINFRKNPGISHPGSGIWGFWEFCWNSWGWDPEFPRILGGFFLGKRRLEAGISSKGFGAVGILGILGISGILGVGGETSVLQRGKKNRDQGPGIAPKFLGIAPKSLGLS